MKNRTLCLATLALGCAALAMGCGASAGAGDTASSGGGGGAPAPGQGGGPTAGSTGTAWGVASGAQSSSASGGGASAASSGSGASAASSGSSASGTTSSSAAGGGPADGSLIGFAAYNADGLATTTGGSGGEVVTVTSYADLVAALGDDAPRVIRISGTIVGGGAPMLRVRSNKTLIGVGADATIDGFGFDVSGWTEELAASTGETCTAAAPEGYTPVSNVIIRNLTFVNSADDSINIPCFSHHVWVDHNTFERSHDGSVDVKRGSDWVTVSWNHFHQTVKTLLLGHDDGNGAQDTGRLHVTYHHNWFDHSDQRHPRVRFGHAHVFNNFAVGLGDYMIGKGVGCSIYADGNYLQDAEAATDDYGGSDLTWTDTNVVINTDPASANGQGFDPSMFYAWTPDPAEQIPTLVPAGAGAGVLTGDEH
ncbi:pectate lyase family protein [Sorangium sp. So ce1078]|uniref:pectate lyase family protein n=1 Tax=Sorangium sp. So ce1078 TaxID=3133329 RepID=UPI003F602069